MMAVPENVPQSMKQIEQMRAYVAKQIAIISSATDMSTEGRHMEVLGIFGGAEFKDLKKLGIPAMDALSTCTKVLSTYFIIKFKRYWRLHLRFEKEGNDRKVRRLERKLIVFESAYSMFQSAHDKALLHIDSIYNQFATRESILGADKEEEETRGLSWVAAGLDRVAARRTAQKIAKREHPSLDRKKLFKFPTFQEALEFAHMEVEEKPVEEAPHKPQKRLAKTDKSNTKSKKKEGPQKPFKPIRPAFQEAQRA